MRKQSKTRRGETIGKGKVTPVQIAFIVDRYLSDNHFTQTRSTFRSEASHLLSKSPITEAPRSLLTLGAIVDEYICLKEQKVLMEQEKVCMEQEKLKVQNLLGGMQQVMNTYNNNASINLQLPPPIPASSISKSGHCAAYTTPALMSASMPSNAAADTVKFSTPNSFPTTSERKRSIDASDASIASKKSRTLTSTNKFPLKDARSVPQANVDDKHTNVLKRSELQLSDITDEPNKLPVQGSSIAKCLFNHPIKTPLTSSSGPTTPPRSSSSQDDKSISPLETCSIETSSKGATTSHQTSTNQMIISSETIRLTPTKKISYYIERNHCVSTSSPVKANLKRPGKRDQVKSRLDFDASDIPSSSEISPIPDRISTSESEKEGDIFDLDLANLDALGASFSLSELLMCDFNIDGERIDYSCQEKEDFSPDSFSGSPYESGNVNNDADQITSQISSTVTKVFSEEDISLPGSDTVRTVKSVTKRVQIVSPVKSTRSSGD